MRPILRSTGLWSCGYSSPLRRRAHGHVHAGGRARTQGHMGTRTHARRRTWARGLCLRCWVVALRRLWGEGMKDPVSARGSCWVPATLRSFGSSSRASQSCSRTGGDFLSPALCLSRRVHARTWQTSHVCAACRPKSDRQSPASGADPVRVGGGDDKVKATRDDFGRWGRAAPRPCA